MRVLHPLLVVKDVRLTHGLPQPVEKLVAILVGTAQPENDVIVLVRLQPSEGDADSGEQSPEE